MAQAVGLSVVMPAFNEESLIAQTALDAQGVISAVFASYEIIIIDDGSRDRTGPITDQLARDHHNIRALHHHTNLGYGAALKSGFAAAGCGLVFLTDGDGQFDLKEINKLLPDLKDYDLVIGYRLNRQDPWPRLVFGQLFNWLMGWLFGLWVKDADCAFKLIKKEVLNNLDLKSNGALVSAELLIKAKGKGYRIKEIGVRHFPRRAGRSTGGSLKVILRAVREIFQMKKDFHAKS